MSTNLTIDLKRASKVYHEGDMIAGVVVVQSATEVRHEGLVLLAEGSASVQLGARGQGLLDAFSTNTKPISLVNTTIELSPAGRIPAGDTAIPFEFPLCARAGAALPGGLLETYHGVFINVMYALKATMKRSFLSKPLHASCQFFVQQPLQDTVPAKPVRCEITPASIRAAAGEVEAGEPGGGEPGGGGGGAGAVEGAAPGAAPCAALCAAPGPAARAAAGVAAGPAARAAAGVAAGPAAGPAARAAAGVAAGAAAGAGMPHFLIHAEIESSMCGLDWPLRGRVRVNECSVLVKSIEMQLVRVETCGVGDGLSRDATEIQNIQVCEGHPLLGRYMPLRMVLPRLFTCPTTATAHFKIEFELNISVIFENDYVVTENFPILLVRSKNKYCWKDRLDQNQNPVQ